MSVNVGVGSGDSDGEEEREGLDEGKFDAVPPPPPPTRDSLGRGDMEGEESMEAELTNDTLGALVVDGRAVKEGRREVMGVVVVLPLPLTRGVPVGGARVRVGAATVGLTNPLKVGVASPVIEGAPVTAAVGEGREERDRVREGSAEEDALVSREGVDKGEGDTKVGVG